MTFSPCWMRKSSTSRPRLPVLSSHFPEAAEAQYLPHVSGMYLPAPVALASEGQDSIWASPDFTVQPSRKVNAQKGEARVRYRVDQAAQHVAFLRAQNVVVAPERYDMYLAVLVIVVAPLAGAMPPLERYDMYLAI